MGGMMVVYCLLIIAAVILAVRWVIRLGKPKTTPKVEVGYALEILKRRYANGEITREEFETKKKDIKG